MKYSILTLFPEMFEGFINASIIKRAIDSNHIEIEVINFRDYTTNKHNKVDDTPYGGGQGMVLMCQPIVDCLKAIKTETSKVILLCPTGKTFKHEVALDLSKEQHLILICGHYEGYDERIRDYVDIEISLGDYVLTGGELGAMVIVDATARLINNVIKEDSHLDDSFASGLLEYPQYTKPRVFEGKEVPEVLLSGHHANIAKWRYEQSLMKTQKYRPDLIEKLNK